MLEELKKLSMLSDEALAQLLKLDASMFTALQHNEAAFPETTQEHIRLLIKLYEQGAEVFNSLEDFREWLNIENFHFDGKKPLTFLYTTSGIQYVRNRLTGMLYGDNA